MPRGKFASTNQEHHLDPGSDTSSVWNFCNCTLEKVGCFLRQNSYVQKTAGKTSYDTKVNSLFANTLKDAVSHDYMYTYKSADNLTRIELLDLRFQLAKVPDQRTHALWQRMDSVDQVTERNAP